MPATAETLRLQRELQAALAQITDAQTRHLVAAWADAWNEVEPDLVATLLDLLVSGERVSAAQLRRSLRLQRALEVIADRLRGLADAAGVRVVADLQAVIDTTGGAQASVIDSQLPPGSDLVDQRAWSRVDPEQVEAIVRRSTEQITALSRPLADDAYQAVRRELIRGVSAGSNPRAVARRMVARARSGFNGGLTRALTIARTEMLDAHREAARLGRAQHADVVTGWRWLCSLGPRTCPACLSMNGSVHPAGDPGPLGHQNCRCTAVPVTKSWSDLGVDAAEPADVFPDAGVWFAGLSRADQVAILGPGRHAAWAAGRLPMDSWAVRRSTPGWRDSFVVAPLRGTPRAAAA